MVNLAVTEDLVTYGDGGFTLQLNAYPMSGITIAGKTPNWVQFVIYVDNSKNLGNNTAAFQWQAWPAGAKGWPQGTSDPQQPIPPFHQPPPVITSVPKNRLPKGSNLTTALITDPPLHRFISPKDT
jgi:hypothetical protein